MGDIASDYDATVEMVEALENKLLARVPGHTLIAYLTIKDKKQREKVWQKQLRTFSKDPNQKGNVRGVMEVAYAMSRYLIALEVALGERHERSQEVHSYEPPSFFKDNDEIPF